MHPADEVIAVDAAVAQQCAAMAAPTVQSGHVVAPADENDVHATDGDGMRAVGCQVVERRDSEGVGQGDLHVANVPTIT